MLVTSLTYAIILSILYMVSLNIIFKIKKNVVNEETSLYQVIIIVNLIGLLLHLACDFVSYHYDTLPHVISNLPLKLYLLHFLIFASLFLRYTLFIIYGKEKINQKKYKLFSAVLIVFFFIVTFSLDTELYRDLNKAIFYTHGSDVTFVYVVVGAMELVIAALCIINYKKINKTKTLPILIFMITSMISTIIQRTHPEININVCVNSLTCLLMFFTIENPDVKMLNELYRNRELMEQGYEDKYNFLFEMTQDAKKPILDLNKITSELRYEEDPKKIKEGMLVINTITRQLDFAVNNVLNVSSFDIQKIKLVDTKYDILKVCESIEATIRGEVKENVSFNMELPKSAPILYGDYMKLRQILYSLLTNACKNTDDGSINLRLNLIEKYDFCRLIFNISDTGKGMSIEKINDILSATGELDKNELEILEKKEFNFKVCQKVVKIMGGNLMIKSTVGKGTDLTLTLDQRVYHEEDNSVLNQYENVISETKRVLIVVQNKDLATYIKKKLNTNNINYSLFSYGGDAVDRLKSGKEFDYIIVEDEMKEMSGMATLQEFKKLKGFNTPVIIVLGKNKDNIKHHYLEDGFADYILADKLEDELIRIINKY